LILQFTDATEQLQEEVFVFTNQIAAVVHSICHSYNGAANKNIGDAFLLSWSLEDGSSSGKSATSPKSTGPNSGGTRLRAKSNQADKALLSVIKICISLQYDKFYLEPLSDDATQRLKAKLKNRAGPVVQMGFGLHAGKAVQGAIGSQRKIDATYVSEAVERAEFLEASTKKYGLNMLMSDSFHKVSSAGVEYFEWWCCFARLSLLACSLSQIFTFQFSKLDNDNAIASSPEHAPSM
jgi:class 3 adenylate cyclase